jgi:hypothetical protein
MKLRLVIDHTTYIPGLDSPWWRLEEWKPVTIRLSGTTEGRWDLITSGVEKTVRAVYEQLRAAGSQRTVMEEFDSEAIAPKPQEAQTMDSDTVINPFKETAK